MPISNVIRALFARITKNNAARSRRSLTILRSCVVVTGGERIRLRNPRGWLSAGSGIAGSLNIGEITQWKSDTPTPKNHAALATVGGIDRLISLVKPLPPTPWFVLEPWYSDPEDRRCPLNASLETVDIRESEKRVPPEMNCTVIALTLSSAHTGKIVLTYSGVRCHSLKTYLCDQGLGEWLRDEFDLSEAGLTLHRIAWRSATNGISHWLIEAAEVSHHWQP